MGQPIDTAYVSIQPDFSRFSSEIASGIERPLADVGSAAARLESDVTATFEMMVSELRGEFEQLSLLLDAGFSSMADASDRSAAEMALAFREAVAEIEHEFTDMELNASRKLNGIGEAGQQAGQKLSHGFGLGSMLLGGAALGGVTAIGAGLEQLSSFGLKTAASLEQTQIALDSLTGSAAAGQKQMAQLQAFANATPFEFNDLVTGAQRFDAFSRTIGMTTDQLIPFMTTLGNVVSETGGGAQALDTITLALGQTAGQGKLTLGNLDQINNAIPGFSAVAAIAKVRGESTAQVMNEISAGSINAKDGIAELLQGMNQFPGAAGAMQRQSQTLLGVFSTFHDVVGQTLSNAFKPIIPAIKTTLTQITPIFGSAIATIAPSIGKVIVGLMQLLGPLVAGLAKILAPVLSALGQALTILGPALGPIANAIAGIATALAPILPMVAQLIAQLVNGLAPVFVALTPVINEFMTVFMDAFKPLIPLIVQLVLAFTPLVPPILQVLQALEPLIPVVAQLLELILKIVTPIIKIAAAFTGWLVAKAIVPIIKGLADAIGLIARFADKVVNFFTSINWGKLGSSIWNAITDAWNAVVNFFENLPGKILSFLENLPSMLGDLASKAMHALAYGIGYGIGLIIKEIIHLPGQLWTLFTKMWDGIVNIFTKGIDAAVKFFEELPGKLLSLAKKIWDGIVHAFETGVKRTIKFFEELPGKIPGILSHLKDSILNAVKDAGKWLWNAGVDAVKGLIKGIESWAKHAWDAIVNFGKSLVHGMEDALGIGSPSKEFAIIGHQTIMGYAMGVDNTADVAKQSVNNAMLPPASGFATVGAGAANGGGASGANPLFGPGSIVVSFNGVIPTHAEAQRTGTAVGQGIANALAQRNIRTAIRGM